MIKFIKGSFFLLLIRALPPVVDDHQAMNKNARANRIWMTYCIQGFSWVLLNVWLLAIKLLPVSYQ